MLTKSADGTAIACEKSGAGPVLVMVEPAGRFRAFSAFGDIVGPLAEHFTVLQFDRRGRGESADTAPYAVDREVEDLAAVIDVAGGSALVYGFSSGALLALHAATAGLPITRLAVLEPPIREEGVSGASDFTRELERLVAARDGAAAVEFFLTEIGVPDDILDTMRGTESWDAMASIAATLAYDAVLGDESPPALLARVDVPTLVLDSEGSSEDLAQMSAAVAGALPHGSHRRLPGAWHGPDPEAQVEALVSFLGG